LCELIIQNSHARYGGISISILFLRSLSRRWFGADAFFIQWARESVGCASSLSPLRTVVFLSLSLSHSISTLARQKTSSIPYQHHLFHPLQHLVSTCVFVAKMFSHIQLRLIFGVVSDNLSKCLSLNSKIFQSLFNNRWIYIYLIYDNS